MTVSLIEEQADQIPGNFPVSVIMQRSPSSVSAWSDYYWEAVGIAVMSNEDRVANQPKLIHESGDIKQYLYPGYKVRLYVDECESYYHNLMSPTPRCYVVARPDEDDTPVPFLVTLSFDEAHAYLEGDELVFDVDIPPELYRWTEDFVLVHYVAEKKKKRKRDSWKDETKGGASS